MKMQTGVKYAKVINNKTDKIWNPLFYHHFYCECLYEPVSANDEFLVSKYADCLGPQRQW